MIPLAVVGGLAVAGIAWILWDMRRFEADQQRRDIEALIDDAERVCRIAASRRNHPSQWQWDDES